MILISQYTFHLVLQLQVSDIYHAWDIIVSSYFSSVPDPPNLLNRTYDNIMFSDYEQQIFGFNHIRNTVFNETREIVCYNQTIYDDMRLEVSEYLGLTLTVENMSPYIDPFYSQVAIQILDNDSKQ